MTVNPSEIQKHIDVLAEFEIQYKEFVTAMEQERRSGVAPWPPDVLSEKRRNLMMKAHRADMAAKASGAGYLVVYEPPAVGGTLRSDTLPAQIMDFGRVGFGTDDDGLDIPREILDYIPAQLGALHVQLEEAESPSTAGQPHPRRRVPTLFGRIRHIPAAVGTLADMGGAVAFVAVLGRLIGVW